MLSETLRHLRRKLGAAAVPVHVVAGRCGHDPAVMLRAYAKRTKKADVSAADIIARITKGALA